MANTVNYNWDIGYQGKNPWFVDSWAVLWQNVDTELYKRSKDLYMQGKILYGSELTGGDLILKSTSHATKGKIYFGANVYFDEVNDLFRFSENLAVGHGKYLFYFPNSDADNNAYAISLFRSDNPDGTRKNDVFRIGYNFAKEGGAVAEVASDGAASICFESHYQPAPATQTIELYAELLKPTSGVSIRPWAIYYNKVSDQLNIQFNADSFSFNDKTGIANTCLYLSTGGAIITSTTGTALKIVAVDGSISFLLAGSVNGIRMGTASGYSTFDSVDKTGAGSYYPLYITTSTTYLRTGGITALTIDSGQKVGIGKAAATYKLEVADDISIDAGKVYRINAVQVVGARVIDARIDDVPNSGDATTDGIIAALQAWAITWGAMAAA